jgi:DNA repair protein RadC
MKTSSSTSKLPQISLRYKSSAVQSLKITCSQDAATSFRKIFDPYTLPLYESFNVIFTNRANVTTGWMTISQGGVSGTVVDVRLMLKAALDCLASGIILCHNHPSANLTASQADIELTRKVKEICKLFDITLLDHIILAPENPEMVREGFTANYLSFADSGLL